jgi:4-alpha-glucanotransferase
LLVAGDRPDSDALFIAAHEFLARSGAALVIAQIDDITAEIEPVNVPTTAGERPNWRRRLSRSVEQLADDPRFAQTFAIFARARRTRLSIG